MPVLQVFRNNRSEESLFFQKQLMILKRDRNIVWKADDDLAKASGEIMIWAQRQRGDVYRLVFVRPDWRMTINGEASPAEFHQDVTLSGRLVELVYQGYRFIFDSVTPNKLITDNS